MHNICRHRGARVCEELSGNRKTYVCPYHGWVYNVDGSLKAARETHVMADFDAAAHGLKPVQCVTYMGLVFINCDPDAGDLVASLENIREPLGAYDLDHAKVAHRKTYRVEANWKLPVCLYPVGLAMRDLGVIEIIGAKRFANILERCHQIAGIGITVDKHQTHVGHALYGLQAVCGGVKISHDVGLARGFE